MCESNINKRLIKSQTFIHRIVSCSRPPTDNCRLHVREREIHSNKYRSIISSVQRSTITRVKDREENDGEKARHGRSLLRGLGCAGGLENQRIRHAEYARQHCGQGAEHLLRHSLQTISDGASPIISFNVTLRSVFSSSICVPMDCKLIWHLL